MRERLELALRPWDYSDIAWLWGALLALMALTIALSSYGRARLAHLVMAAAGAAVTLRFAFQLATHYARCAACSLVFDVSPNAASWAFFYDYLMCAVVLALFAFQESRRFGRARPALRALTVLIAPLVAAPLIFADVHAAEEAGAKPSAEVPRLRWVYAALTVLSAPFVMPALPRDHFGDLGGEFYWDGTSNQANSYVAYAVLLLFGQVFLYALPRTRGFWMRVASLFLAFNCLAAYIALFFVFHDDRLAPPARRHAFAPRMAGSHIGAVLLGNFLAALFGVTLRFTHFVIKAPETVCHEGEVTRARELPRCLADLEAALPERERAAAAPGAGSLARALPEETRRCIALAKEALAADEGRAREIVARLGRHHGSDLPSCQEAASANYAVLNECPIVAPVTMGPRAAPNPAPPAAAPLKP
jgi:hypothetical protein